jgi:hypothetical protein
VCRALALLSQMGVKTGTVAYALTNQYHRLPSIGTCFDVCVAGFALQGGLGQIFRYHGTAADFIQHGCCHSRVRPSLCLATELSADS